VKMRFGLLCFVTTIFSSFCALWPAPLQAQETKAKASQERYLILDTRKLTTLQKELDDAAKAGYRIISGNAGYTILALELDPEGRKHEYLVTGSIQEMAEKGKLADYRVLPFAFSGGRWVGLGAVLEKLAPSEPQIEYQIVQTARTSTLIKEINEWAGKGFSLAAVSAIGLNYALMERAAGAPASGPADRYLLLATTLRGTMEKELADAVAKGNRLAAISEGGDEMVFILEKRAPGEPTPDYRLITTTRTGKLEREILAAVPDGYRLLPMALCAQERTSMMGTTYEVVALMEKSANPPPIQYKFLATSRVSTLQRELAESVAAGWSLKRLFLTYKEQMILLEKNE
jgi:hypothetical protein